MTARYLLTLSLMLGIGGLATGCSGDTTAKDTITGDDDDDTVGDDDDDDTVGDTFVITDDTFDPTGGGGVGALAVAYQFGYNQQTRTTAAVTLDAGTGNPLTIPPSIDVYLGESGWTGDTSLFDDYCAFTLDMTNGTLDAAFVAGDPRHLIGFLRDGGDPVLTDCFDGAGFDLDPAYWGTDFGTYMAGYGEFGMAIGAMDTYTEGIIAPYLTATLQPTDLVGGTLRDGFFIGGDIPEVYGFAWEVDPVTFDVALDANLYLQPVPYASLDLGNNAGSAWYDMNLLFYYIFDPPIGR